MENISQEIGLNIRRFRKMRKLTIEDLANKISKSKATISKYEKGEIILDVVSLYQIADALKINVEQLLYYSPKRSINFISPSGKKPAFFNGVSHFYSYLFDGRTNKIMRCAFDILTEEVENSKYKIIMYMNFKDYNNYQICENTYLGYMEHYDALTNILMRNQDTPMEQVTASILASFLESDTKWGLFFGISSRPMMPIAVKMLFSRKKLTENQELIEKLKISKEDIRLLKIYNMLSAT